MDLIGDDPRATIYLSSLLHEFGLTGSAAPAHGCFWGAWSGPSLETILFVGNSKNHTSWGNLEHLPRLLQEASEHMPNPRLYVGPSAHAPVIRRNFMRLNLRPCLDREQSFYVLNRETLEPVKALDLEPADLKDLDGVVDASAAMIEEDLLIPRANLDFARLRDLSQERIRSGRIWVHKQNREVVFKTEEVCRGPEGLVVGGVFTHPSHRGLGLATRGMASWAGVVLNQVPRLALHVNRNNAAAIKAYERAGFRRVSTLRLIMTY